MKKIRSPYDKVADSYDNYYCSPEDMAENQFLKRILSQCMHPGSILDVGCGTGAFSDLFPKRGITGIDPSKKMIDVAKKKHPLGNRLLVGKIQLVAKEKFDNVISLFGPVSYMTQKEVLVLKKLCKVAKFWFLIIYKPDYYSRITKKFGKKTSREKILRTFAYFPNRIFYSWENYIIITNVDLTLLNKY